MQLRLNIIMTQRGSDRNLGKIKWHGIGTWAILALATFVLAVPISFNFRSYISVAGITAVELAALSIILSYLLTGNYNYIIRRYPLLITTIAVFIVWSVVRGYFGIIEGNLFYDTAFGYRYYIPYVVVLIYLGSLYAYQPNPYALLKDISWLFTAGLSVYTVILLTVIVWPPLQDVLMIDTWGFRIGTSTTVITLPLLLTIYIIRYSNLISRIHLFIAFTVCSVIILLHQYRFGAAIMAIMVICSVLVYFVFSNGKLRYFWISQKLMVMLLTLIAGVFAVLLLTVDNFISQFVEVFFIRVARNQEGLTVWDSMIRYSFGYGEWRERVLQWISERPLVGFGEGARVGATKLSQDGFYIDSVPLTMWYKNGIVGVVLFYSIWIAILYYVVGKIRAASGVVLGIAATAVGSIIGFILWSLSNIFLMYGWVMYPILVLIGSYLYFLDKTAQQHG